ncbi:MAG: 4Fe-4S binding protein [Bacteroidales bacterium]|nr:4Fe-4S binding protein [Bacteroidales bacterium]
MLSIFINRPWCTFLCPTGAFFSLFMKKAAQNSQEKDSNTNKE